MLFLRLKAFDLCLLICYSWVVKIVVVSDTHRSVELAEQVIRDAGPLDLLIHLGDYLEDGVELAQRLGVAFYGVRGDNDFSPGKAELVLELSGVRLFLVHGHSYNIDEGLEALYNEARAREAQVVLFGHSHRPGIFSREGIYMLNPGNLYLAEKENSLGVLRLELPGIFLGIFYPRGKGFIHVRKISPGAGQHPDHVQCPR